MKSIGLIQTVSFIREEIAVNPHRRVKLMLVNFRLAQYFRERNIFFYSFFKFVHNFISKIVIGMEIPVGVEVGWGLRIFHAFGIVINEQSVLGKNCILRQNVTIGNVLDENGTPKVVAGRSCPVIGDDVEFGCGCALVGPISVGSGVRIGALAVITKNVQDHQIVVGTNKIL